MPLIVTNKENLPAMRRACGNCGRLGHLSRTCKAPEKAHLKVGIEVEGYWRLKKDPDDATNTRWDEVHREASNWNMSGTADGSLHCHNDYESWEFRTRPGTLGEAVNQLVAIYPDGTDNAVGMHVHVSFDKSDSMLLASKAFFDYFADRWQAWGTANNIHSGHEFWSRLNGNNVYCRRNLSRDWRDSRNVASMDRYRQLNFSSLTHHSTVECRLLPMFRDAKLAVAAVEHLIDIYESWLTGGEADARFFASIGGTKEFAANSVAPLVEVRKEFALADGAVSITRVAEVVTYPALIQRPGYITMRHSEFLDSVASNLQIRLNTNQPEVW